MDLEGGSAGVTSGNGTTGVLKVTIPGTYLVLAAVSVGPGLNTSPGSEPPGPPVVAVGAAIGVNGPPEFGSNLVTQAQGHFHCGTSPDASSPLPWNITIGGTTYSLPALDRAPGNLSLGGLVRTGANDQIGVFLQSTRPWKCLAATSSCSASDRDLCRVLSLGYPGPMGGANTEAWHTANVWRQHGIDVTFIPTWGSDSVTGRKADRHRLQDGPRRPSGEIKRRGRFSRQRSRRHVQQPCPGRLENVEGPPLPHRVGQLHDVPFRQRTAKPTATTARRTPTSTSPNSSEPSLRSNSSRLAYNHGMGHLIRGAFAFDDIPYAPKPHKPGEDFWIGRLARPDLDKWSSNHWQILARVPYRQRRASPWAGPPSLTVNAAPRRRGRKPSRPNKYQSPISSAAATP